MSISISHLQFSYQPPHNPVIHIPKWQLGYNEPVFIHGPSGCGKSTWLNILSGLLPVLSGEVDILGCSLHKMSNRERDRFRANHIGYIQQRFNLIPYLSPIDNLKLACQFSKNKNQHRAIQTCLSDLLLEDSTWQKPVRHLSVGQQQRVAIARALIHQPQLIIADEPTSSLDEHNRTAFISQLMQQVTALKCALVFVSHDLSLASHFSRVEKFTDMNKIDEAV